MKKFPPKGYKAQEFPLPHNFTYDFFLGGESTTKNTTICPILHTTELAVGAEAIEVNPSNALFGEDPGNVIHNGSIVPRINVTIQATLSKAAEATDAIWLMKLKWWPIYTAFLSNLEAEDARTAVQVEDILELQHDVTNKDTYPLYNTVKLSSADSYPLSTKPYAEALADVGLTTTAVLEGVTYSDELLFDAFQYYGNAGMLKKSVGRRNTVTLRRGQAYNYFSKNFTNPMVKRGNPYTFCGIVFHLPPVGDPQQYNTVSDTSDIGHVHIGMTCRYDEWNPNFDQNAY